jgi:sugar phosphate isomerase/epimerase
MEIAITATPSASRFAPIVLRGSVADAFATAEQLGYDGVELHLRYPGDVDAAQVQQLMQTHNLGVPTLGTGMAAGEDGLTFANPDAGIRQRALDRLRDHIALAARIGSAVTVGLIWGRVTNDPAQRQTRIGYASDCLDQCCRMAQQAGVTVLFEALNRYESDYPHTLEQAVEIIERMHAPNLRLLADTYHMNIEEADMHESLRRASAHLGHVHLVDSNRQAPGHGHCDLRGVVQTLAEIGYKGYLSFEVTPIPSPQQAAEDGIRTVRGYPALAARHG